MFVAAPILAKKGWDYSDGFIGTFAAALFGWDLYWLLAQPPRRRV